MRHVQFLIHPQKFSRWIRGMSFWQSTMAQKTPLRESISMIVVFCQWLKRGYDPRTVTPLRNDPLQ